MITNMAITEARFRSSTKVKSLKSLYICDRALENRSYVHILYFKKYKFEYRLHFSSLVIQYSHARYVINSVVIYVAIIL